MTIYALIGLGLVVLAQTLAIVHLSRSLATVRRASDRVERLASALELLTDTTEAGFGNVAAELDRLGARRTTTGSTRKATSRRISTAARHGRSIEDIATTEALSESEVRLHMHLATDQMPEGANRAAVRG